MTLLHLGRHRDALADLDHAVRQQPGAAWLLVTRAMVHRLLGGYDAALADADLAGRLDPDEPGVHRERAGVHLATGRWREALDALARCSPARPARPSATACGPPPTCNSAPRKPR